MKRSMIKFLVMLGLLIPAQAHAQTGKVGATSPASVTVIGGDDGSGDTARGKINPSTGALLIEALNLPPFYGAGIASDTTAKTAAQVGNFDIDSAPWTTAYLYKHKGIEITVNSVGGATTGTFVFRIQGSYLGTSDSWRDIYAYTAAAGGVGTADTVQIVFTASAAGSAVGVPRPFTLDTWGDAGFIMWQTPLNVFSNLRCVVQNRSNGTSALDYTVKFLGSK